MPELPEVETIVQGLKKLLINRLIADVWIREAKLIAFPEPEEFAMMIKGKKIIDFSRRGKYILFHLEGEKTLVIHLRMTGKLLVQPASRAVDKHTHIIFKLDDGSEELRFHNIRKFGRLYLIERGKWEDAGGLFKLGPEPLAEDFRLADFKERFKGRKGMMKSLLLNQSFIAGLGNIYVDEALFRARIRPDRRADTLSSEEIERLYIAIRDVLTEGIKYGGTTFRDYVNAQGEKGGFQRRLKVYQREGEKCYRCEHEIIREKLGGRSSYYCPDCQQ